MPVPRPRRTCRELQVDAAVFDEVKALSRKLRIPLRRVATLLLESAIGRYESDLLAPVESSR